MTHIKYCGGVLKYGDYEKEVFHKERKEFKRTLRRIFKRVYNLSIKDSEISIDSDRWQRGQLNWRDPKVKLSYKEYYLIFDKEELYILYYFMYSNKFSGRFHPIEFFDYVRNKS